jgi:hypothetical protein
MRRQRGDRSRPFLRANLTELKHTQKPASLLRVPQSRIPQQLFQRSALGRHRPLLGSRGTADAPFRLVRWSRFLTPLQPYADVARCRG